MFERAKAQFWAENSVGQLTEFIGWRMLVIGRLAEGVGRRVEAIF